VRPGLVTVGVAFLLLAAGTIVTVNLLPGPPAAQQDKFTLAPTVVPPRSAGGTEISGTPSSTAELTVRWTTSGGPVSMFLYPAGTCLTSTADCDGNGSVAQCLECFHGSTWSIAGPQQFSYDLAWVSGSNVPINLTASAVETWNATATSPLWSVLLVDAVAVALGGVGAVAVFLGMFLRGGVYRGPAPLVSRSAEDVDELTKGPPPP